jgi:DNA-binding NarL/FixJ family response regulator
VFAALRGAHLEDLFLRIVLPAARALLSAGTADEREGVRHELRTTAALIAQRIQDEDVRVRWFRGPLGRELSDLAGSPGGAEPQGAREEAQLPLDLGAGEARLLWLLVEGRTNREIATELGVSEEELSRQLAVMYAKIGVSSRGEAAVFAFREGVV